MPNFPELPFPTDPDGTARHVGVEIEFAGLTELEAAEGVRHTLGGTVSTDQHSASVSETDLGDIRVILDTALTRFNNVPLLPEALTLSRGLVPVELITDPIQPSDLVYLDRVRRELQLRGARGSRDGMLLGFGVHLNTAVIAADHPHTLATIQAYALLEAWLRDRAGIDLMRRLLPFVEPWPAGFVQALMENKLSTLSDVFDLAAQHIRSRNHGLDLLPLFKHACPDQFKDTYGSDNATSGRPAFHFRLPDCRIDEQSWSLADPWRMWITVENLAADPVLMASLTRAWQERDASEKSWIARVDDVLASQLRRVEAL